MKRLRAAILGYGRSGSSMHAKAYEANADAFKLVAVCDIDADRRRQAVDRFSCTPYEDYRRMLAEENLDVVSIVTRSDQHCQMTCDALAAGVSVLVTKPWAVNADEARRMCDAADGKDALLMPWLPARWGCVYQRLKQIVDQGTIGDVFLIRRIQSSFATRSDWQTERRYGGGYLLNWGPHVVDPAVLLGGSAPATVFGRLRQTINPGDGEDVVFAVMTLQNGVIVQAEYTVSVSDLPNWFIQGTRGTIEVRGQQVRILQKTPATPGDPTKYADMKATGEAETEETVEGALYGDEAAIYAHMARALRREETFAVAPQDALDLSILLDAVRASHGDDRLVHVDGLDSYDIP